MKRTRFIIAAAAAVTTMVAVPVMAANGASDQAKPAPIKHTMTMHKQHHASLRMRDNGGLMSRGVADPRDVNANLALSNANASANRPVESLATQLGATVTKSGNASDPVCKPGNTVPMPDGRSYPCQ